MTWKHIGNAESQSYGLLAIWGASIYSLQLFEVYQMHQMHLKLFHLFSELIFFELRLWLNSEIELRG